MKKIIGSLFLFISCLACEPMVDDIFNVYVIKAGDHYTSTRHVETLQTNILQFDARFDESAIYTFSDAGFQDSKNKLMGFSDCNSMHHENSARFAWQWYNNQIEIYAYCYRNGDRVEEFLGVVEPGEIARYRVELTAEAYIFRFKDKEVSIARGASCSVGTYLILWPYFGGQLPAPHDISIYIRRF